MFFLFFNSLKSLRTILHFCCCSCLTKTTTKRKKNRQTKNEEPVGLECAFRTKLQHKYWKKANICGLEHALIAKNIQKKNIKFCFSVGKNPMNK